MLLCKRNICFILENFVLLLSHFLVISTANISKVVSMLFSQRWSNADEQTQLSFSTKYKSWNSIDLSTLNQRNSFNVVSTLFYQRWNNVDKHTSAQLSFSTKFQRWNNIGSSTLNRRNSINVVSTLFCQRWNNVDKCTSAQLSFSIKYQRRNNVDERWRSTLFQRWINVDVFAGVDNFSRSIKVYTMKDRFAITAIRFVYDYCLVYGIPEKHYSDQDPGF